MDSSPLVHFIASGNDLDNDLPYLQAIIDEIHNSNALIAHDWLGAAIARKKKTPDIEKVDWSHIVEQNLDAVRRSDIVIAEITFSDFNQGMHTFIASRYHKPTLILSRDDVKGHFISGIEDKYLTLKQYSTEEDLRSLIHEFIAKNAIAERDLRFNMFLDRRIYKYLREEAYETGRNKSSIVRHILQRAIDERNKQ
ncbi:MAG TPA: hypothetical protein VJ841_00585 [Candidatus Saccharimonadales bacterium]|nr:hypothetical protein [Candidatus Saccharimonadales bacterium]